MNKAKLKLCAKILLIEGGDFRMMGWQGNGFNCPMFNGSYGYGMGVLAFIFWLVIFIDLVLLGIFLWKKNSKK